MMNKRLSKVFTISLMLLLALACNKDNGNSENDKNWEDWIGVKVIMEDAGFETSGIKILLGDTPDHTLYLPDLKWSTTSWIGEKNGLPWIGIGINHPSDSQYDRFIREFVFSSRNAAKSITKENEYKQTIHLDYKRIKPFLLLIDEQYTYIGIFDIYTDGDHEYEENPTIYIHDGQKFCGETKDFVIDKKAGINVGWEHDLLAFNACYSKDGKKQYDITKEVCQRLYPMEADGWYQTYALSREKFLTVGFYNTITCVEVAIANFKTGDIEYTTRLSFDNAHPEKAEEFVLKSHNGNTFVYKLVVRVSDGSKKEYTVTIDVNSNTATME